MRKNEIDVTIAVLNYNRENFIERSIRSCLDQVTTNKVIEVIVVDDNSKDNSLKLLERFKKKITIIKNKKNYGVGYCSNLAVKKAKGKYFMRVDSDDYINKFTTEIMSEILDFNRQLAFVYSDHYRVDEYSLKQNVIKVKSLEDIFLHGAGIMFKKKAILSVGNYNKRLRGAEDHELILKLINNKNKFFRIPIPLYRYHIHKNNLTAKQNRNMLVRKIEKMYKNPK